MLLRGKEIGMTKMTAYWGLKYWRCPQETVALEEWPCGLWWDLVKERRKRKFRDGWAQRGRAHLWTTAKALDWKGVLSVLLNMVMDVNVLGGIEFECQFSEEVCVGEKDSQKGQQLVFGGRDRYKGSFCGE